MTWAASETLPLDAIRLLLADFRLGQLEHARWAGGYSNQNYFVTTTQGEYLVKFLINRRVAIEEELLYLKRLHEWKYPAVRYLAMPDGRYVWLKDQLKVVVEPWLPGQPPTRSDEMCRAIGTQLARLHLLPHADLPVTSNDLSYRYIVNGMAEIQRTFSREMLAPLFPVYEQVRELPYDRLPVSIQHGDPTRNNCLFDQGQFVAWIDWEEVGKGPALFDLAVAILSCCYRYQGPGGAQREESWYRSFLQSYCELRPLTALEEECFPLALRYAGLALSLWSLLQFGIYYPDKTLLDGWLHPGLTA